MNSSTFKSKKIFLAGATGLAGTSVLKYLLDNYPSTAVKGTYFHTEPFIRHERIEYIHADLTNPKDCGRAVKGCGSAIMAAANTGGAGSQTSEPSRQVTDNLVMDARILEALSLEGVKRVVFISSAAIYQEFEGFIREDQLDLNQDPHPAYFGVGWAKRAAEKLCQFWHEKYALEIIIARCSNIFGPYDRFDLQRSNFIPAIIRKAVDRMDPFEVWGSPEVTRDVIYGDDFARAIVQLLAAEKIKFDVFNLGSALKTTVGDVVKWALSSAKHTPQELLYIKNKPTTIKFRALDCSKIYGSIGWKPDFSIQEAIEKTMQWWIDNRAWWRK